MSSLEFVEIGSSFGGRYRLKERLGGCDDRAVYEVLDEDKGHACALELLTLGALPDGRRGEVMNRIERLRSAEHPQLVLPTHGGFNKALEIFFLASPLLDGVNLASISRQSGPVPPEQVAAWMSSVANALSALHAAGHAHCQLSAGSLILTRDPKGKPVIMVLDIEKEGLITRSSAEPFMAPEVLAERSAPMKRTAAADIYSLGKIAATLLGVSQPKVKLPSAFDGWLAKVTADKPEGRFVTVLEATDTLKLALGVSLGPAGKLRQSAGYGAHPDFGDTLRPEDIADAAIDAAATNAAATSAAATSAAASDAAASDAAANDAAANDAAANDAAAGDPEAANAATLIDPLGDTQAGSEEINNAADAAIDQARRDKAAAASEQAAGLNPGPTPPVIKTMEEVVDDDELARRALGSASNGPSGLVIAVIVATLIAVAVALTRI